MALRSRPFSIYLLKPGFDALNSLADEHTLEETEADEIPDGSTLYILDAAPHPPWWKEFFGVQGSLFQESKGAILFLPVNDRCFALTFGQVQHNLKDSSFEYDFGLRATLNMLDPSKLRSADMVEPGPARRKRTQVPISTELTYLDFDANSEIIRSLTGRVKAEYVDLFKNVTGSTSLKLSLKLLPDDLPNRCQTLLGLYDSQDYKAAFPNIENITPVNDPAAKAHLDAALLEAVRAKGQDVTLTIPDLVDYRDNTSCMFRGGGRASDIYPDITIEKLYEFVEVDGAVAALTLVDLHEYRMILTDTDGGVGGSYSLYRGLLFDYEDDDDGGVYHLCEGSWYRVEKVFAARLKAFLDAKCEESPLPPYDHDVASKGKQVYSEENYTKSIAENDAGLICLDQTDISPTGSTAIEPCDLFKVGPDPTAISKFRGTLFHIKISTRSSHLSHLFNQGVNSIELIEMEEVARDKMKALVADRLKGNDQATYLAPFDHFDFRVVFGIITHKGAESRSSNLPLFSKLSLMRNMQRLDLMRVPNALVFIHDASPAKDGHKKYDMYLVEVVAGPGGNQVRAVPNQGVPSNVNIERCPKAVTNSLVGTKYNLGIRVGEDGKLSSYHSWPYSPA